MVFIFVVQFFVYIETPVTLDVSMVNRTERSEGEFKELTHVHSWTLQVWEQPVAVSLA